MGVVIVALLLNYIGGPAAKPQAIHWTADVRWRFTPASLSTSLALPSFYDIIAAQNGVEYH